MLSPLYNRYLLSLNPYVHPVLNIILLLPKVQLLHAHEKQYT